MRPEAALPSGASKEPATIDRLSALLERFRVRARLFHTGPLCGSTHFDARPGRAFLHVLRRGEMVVTHRARSGVERRLELREPTLLFYPAPLEHEFHNTPREGSDFVCATLDFEGGTSHPIVQALPPLVALPLRAVPGIEQSLQLLFAETERVRCGQRLLADPLFEVLLIQLLRWLLDHPETAQVKPGLLSGLSHPKLARALTAMHEHPGQGASLDALARAAGMSRSAFAVAFRDSLGTTPAQYLIELRVRLGQSMLLGGASVKAVSDELGYANASSFSRAFARACGCSPRDWLKRERAAGR